MQEKKPQIVRKKSTETAGKVSSMVRAMIGDVLKAREVGKTIAYTFIHCAYDEIIRAMDIVPHWVENYA